MALRSEDPVYAEGPWSHRTVSANGTRFHIAERGDGPLVLLLHGFPEFWWAWRHQIQAVGNVSDPRLTGRRRAARGPPRPLGTPRSPG